MNVRRMRKTIFQWRNRRNKKKVVGGPKSIPLLRILKKCRRENVYREQNAKIKYSLNKAIYSYRSRIISCIIIIITIWDSGTGWINAR